jgi:hypothetical protein
MAPQPRSQSFANNAVAQTLANFGVAGRGSGPVEGVESPSPPLPSFSPTHKRNAHANTNTQ